MENNINPNANNVNMVPNESKKVSLQKVLLLILILMALFGAFCVGQVYERKRVSPNSEQVQTTAKDMEESMQEKWTIFRNDVLGIEFNYPSSWGGIVTHCGFPTNTQGQIISSSCGEVFLTAPNYLDFTNRAVFLSSTPRPDGRDGWVTDTFWIKDQTYINDFCSMNGRDPSQNPEVISCDVYTNKNGIKIARISSKESEGIASSLIPSRVVYFVYTGNKDFPAISFGSKPENKDLVDKVVDSLKLVSTQTM